MAETLINSNQIRTSGDISSKTLLNSNQVRTAGDISTKTLINPNQISSSQPDWQLGDRLDNKATFVGYFDSIDPDTQATQRYAYFVLDGNYRSVGKYASSTSASDALSTMTDNIFYWSGSQAPKPIDSTLSGTWVMSQIKDLGVTNYPLFDHANNISVSYNGNTYTAVVPNAYQLKQIWENREFLDTLDTSGVNNLTNWTFGTRKRAYTCAIGQGNTGYTTFTGLVVSSSGSVTSTGSLDGGNFTSGYVPIIEIPVATQPISKDFYAYTFQNETIYTDDNPVNKGTFTLTNATNNGFTDEGGGLFSGVNGGHIELDGTPDWQSLDTWAYIIKVKLNSFKTACLLGSADDKTPLLTFLNDGHLRFFANSPSFYDSSLQYGLNEWLYVKPYFTGTAYKVDISSSGRFKGEEVNYITVNSSVKNSATAKVWFGNVSSDTAQYLDGVIDMSECKKIENGVETSFGSFSGSKSIIYDSTLNEIAPQPSYSYQASALNATVIVALTDNNGIISGFSASNTIATNIIPDNLISYDCILHIKTPQTLLTTADTALFGHYNSGADLGYNRTTNKLFISNGSSSIDGTTVIQADTKYFIRLKLDSNTVSLYTLLNNNNYTLDTLPDLSNWTLECSGTTAYNIISNTLQICGASYYGQYFNGSLDAVNSRFTLNGVNYNLYSLAKIIINNKDYIKDEDNDITALHTYTNY